VTKGKKNPSAKEAHRSGPVCSASLSLSQASNLQDQDPSQNPEHKAKPSAIMTDVSHELGALRFVVVSNFDT